ncbi:Pituitary adenylate cyclase-activating polypeptide type I receptor [Merluccius polli]|uniref:Pituitary adenylate cyclase-activating polypeptide type I receptor n=1 Tax=Merluccius polli TaxID=89951 RepID=A0AA47NRP5_MERPO|nr:Pituitary adenylate cyclase-activating polypeptide type I receptor [Merluccius polli]
MLVRCPCLQGGVGWTKLLARSVAWRPDLSPVSAGPEPLPSSPPYLTACYHDNGDLEEPGEQVRGDLDHWGQRSLGLISRRLLCVRTYIHLNLFVSFMLRSVAVFIKDSVLFSDQTTDHCTVSTVCCKAAVTFFHFCVLGNFSWLLVEALHLQALLLLPGPPDTHFSWVLAVAA